MDPDQPDQTQAPPPPESVVSEPAPVVENPQPISPPETPSPEPISETPPTLPEIPTTEPVVGPPVDIPIPNFRFPFNGDFSVTFPFNASPITDEMKAKFLQWGISGHHGIDFGLPEGTEVLAVDSGKVILSDPNGDYGNCVFIQHPWGQSLYAHLKETKVTVDQNINSGDVIGISGQTGAAFGPHLHFGVKPNNPNDGNSFLGFINPTSYLPQNPQSIVPEPDKPKEEVKPEEPKPIVEIPTPVIPEPTINIEPVPQPSQPPPPSNPSAEEVAKAGTEDKFKDFLKLGNQAKQENRDEHLQKIISFAQEKKQVTNQDVRDLVHVSQTTATRYLKILVNKGILRMDKKARATTYLY